MPFDSKIISTVPSILEDISNKQWEFHYGWWDTGFRSSDFHVKCDGCVNTQTLIVTTNDSILGGFTPVAWDSSGSSKPDSTKKSFLFTLKNARNITRWKFCISTTANAIHCGAGYGPTFWNGHCIYVADQCNTNTNSYTNLTGVYINDTGVPDKEAFTGEYNFQVKDIETFAII
jgi:hypothetical protein